MVRKAENREEWKELVVKSPVEPQRSAKLRDVWRWRKVNLRYVFPILGISSSGQALPPSLPPPPLSPSPFLPRPHQTTLGEWTWRPMTEINVNIRTIRPIRTPLWPETEAARDLRTARSENHALVRDPIRWTRSRGCLRTTALHALSISPKHTQLAVASIMSRLLPKREGGLPYQSMFYADIKPAVISGPPGKGWLLARERTCTEAKIRK